MLKLRKNSRVPNEGLLRIQWIESISKTQQYDIHSTNFDICELHFTKEDFVERESSKVLNKFAIPSSFKTVQNSSEPYPQFDFNENASNLMRCCKIKQCANQVASHGNVCFFK